MKYELIGYISPTYNTNESAHATINGDLFTVKGYKDDAAGRQIIGRTPLVRVTLVDGNSNNAIAAVGYIKVKITDVNATPLTVTSDGIKKDYTVACAGNALDKELAVTWDEIESKVLKDVDMSKEEFEANYKFVSETQYKENAQNGFDALSTNIGTVSQTTEADGGHQTNVLKWTVTENEAYQLLKKDGDVITTWVKFTPKSTARALKEIFIKLSWTAPKVNNTPKATIQNSDKKAAAWHAANKNTAGFDQLHIQVGNATDPEATCEFHNLVIANTLNSDLETIVKNQIKGQYPALAKALTVSYKFAKTSEQSHKSYIGVAEEHKYNITVNNDGSEIMADGTVIARINATDGTISVEKNSTTMDILNKYGKVSELEDALTFTVLAEVKTCEPAADIVNLTNKKFDVKVIKPLFVESVKVNNMTLNNFASLTQKVTFNFVDFNNYTQQKFWANSNHHKAFKEFYGIESIEQVGTITTNYSGAWKAIDEKDIKVEYVKNDDVDHDFLEVKNGIVEYMGKVKLTQVNQSRANGFDVKVPVEIEYNWGTLKTDIKFHVNPATAAAKKH